MPTDNLPARLKKDALGEMASDSDISCVATVFASRAGLSDNPKTAGAALLCAALTYLRDWCAPTQRTYENLKALLLAAVPDEHGGSALKDRFFEIRTGCRKVRKAGTVSWVPSDLVRQDGRVPRDENGLSADEDAALACYEAFQKSGARDIPSMVSALLPVLDAQAAYEQGTERSRI